MGHVQRYERACPEPAGAALGIRATRRGCEGAGVSPLPLSLLDAIDQSTLSYVALTATRPTGMPRRAASHDTDDSLKENNGLLSEANVSGSPKANLNDKRAAMRVAEDAEGQENAMDEDETRVDGNAADEDDQDEGEDAEGSLKGRKRARANTQGDAHPQAGSSKPEKRGHTLPRDEDGYVLLAECIPSLFC